MARRNYCLYKIETVVPVRFVDGVAVRTGTSQDLAETRLELEFSDLDASEERQLRALLSHKANRHLLSTPSRVGPLPISIQSAPVGSSSSNSGAAWPAAAAASLVTSATSSISSISSIGSISGYTDLIDISDAASALASSRLKTSSPGAQPHTAHSDHDQPYQYFVCLMSHSESDEQLSLFKSELQAFVGKIKRHLVEYKLVAYKSAAQSAAASDGLRHLLSSWYAYCIDWPVRCVELCHKPAASTPEPPQLPRLLHAALSGRPVRVETAAPAVFADDICRLVGSVRVSGWAGQPNDSSSTYDAALHSSSSSLDSSVALDQRTGCVPSWSASASDGSWVTPVRHSARRGSLGSLLLLPTQATAQLADGAQPPLTARERFNTSRSMDILPGVVGRRAALAHGTAALIAQAPNAEPAISEPAISEPNLPVASDLDPAAFDLPPVASVRPEAASAEQPPSSSSGGGDGCVRVRLDGCYRLLVSPHPTNGFCELWARALCATARDPFALRATLDRLVRQVDADVSELRRLLDQALLSNYALHRAVSMLKRSNNSDILLAQALRPAASVGTSRHAAAGSRHSGDDRHEAARAEVSAIVGGLLDRHRFQQQQQQQRVC
eukprot:TRINITY_DN2776_c0_g1_i2.p1 TRINITY_DN2776_c0_g1~~TRINITY_DN2776_c0_g1_i2.p1  ORF type:complete len:612 (+),score=238.47 TRINITY_DN2776_c0_g1_i2:994-2829(+)